MNELVSIIMPVLNRKDTIMRAITSVINQTYVNWELIIVDDGSVDGTQKILEEMVQIDMRIKFVSNIYKKGVSGARNTGIKCSNGDYLAFLDSDDEWFEWHLLECMNALKNTGYKFCSSLWIENRYGITEKVDEKYKYPLDDIKKN